MQLVIFDPRLGSEETAERKLLFYHPASTPLDQRVKTVGLAEAVTNLLSSFTAHDPEALHTQHGRQIFLQPEPNLWLVLLAPNQASPAVKPTAADASAKDKDSADLETLPAAEEALQDGTLMALLRRVYATLRMTCGPLSAIAEERGVDELRTLLGHVLPLLLKLVLSVVLEDPSRPDLLDMVEGMCFLPVDRRLYLRVHYLTNVLRSRHPCIQHVMVMHAEHLVWSSLTQAATQAVVTMLVDESAPQWQQPVWYQQLAALLVPELQPLAPLLAETQQRMTQLEEPYRFVYFNRHNLALKSSMRAAKAGAQRMGLGAEVKLLLDRVHTDVAGGGLSGGGRLKEVVLHAGPAGWIVGRGGGSRGLYVVLDGREYAWSEVLQEVQALMQSHFSNIFLDGT
eukprot:jgi/Chrpa1/2944/Chrysochromulina_OHIO_Genome00002271-RA